MQDLGDRVPSISLLLRKIDNLRMGKQHGQHAPHKPLLILYALGELGRGHEALSFRELDPSLTRLLEDFGPRRARYHPEYPFWRLQNDGLWIVTTDEPVQTRQSNTDAKKSELLQKNAIGRFPAEVLQVLRSDPSNIGAVAKRLLESNFPETLHHDILDSIGLSPDLADGRPKRDPEFRRKVLRAYESRCCVCGYDMRLGNRLAGLEAAHIMWHTVGGPDEETNGLSLCVLHHKVFDLGAFTIDTDGRTIVCSQELSGTTRKEWLIGFHGEKLRNPQSESYFPEEKYLSWHRRTIFKRPGRDLQ